MRSPELAAVLLEHGRHTTGPLIEAYLQHLVDAGHLVVQDVAEAFQLFYGLVIQDLQIRSLLGEPAPSAKAVGRTAERAVDRFLALGSPH